MKKAKLYIAHDDGGFVDIGDLLLADGYDIYKSPANEHKPHFDFSRRPNSGKSEWHERGDLPPVGTECEAKFDKEWFTVEILKYNENKIAACHILNSYIEGGNLKWSCEFRPLKSERERAIEEIIEVVSKSDGTFQSAAEMLYDAGFRKERK